MNEILYHRLAVCISSGDSLVSRVLLLISSKGESQDFYQSAFDFLFLVIVKNMCVASNFVALLLAILFSSLESGKFLFLMFLFVCFAWLFFFCLVKRLIQCAECFSSELVNHRYLVCRENVHLA